MANDPREQASSILGDINPTPAPLDHKHGLANADEEKDEAEESMTDGSGRNHARHAGARDVTDGGGTGAEVGGTRNYRTGTGATGGDVGNRPE